MRSMWQRVSQSCGRRSIHVSSRQWKILNDPENKGTHQSGVNFDTLGSWSNRLPLSVNMEQSVRTGVLIPKIDLQHIGTATSNGRRQANEDRILLKELRKNFLLVGVLDGHGGSEAADFAHAYIPDFVNFFLQRGETDLSVILHKTFVNLNNLLARHVFHYSRDTSLNSGTTATVALLRNSVELVVGHVGDSRAVLYRDGDALPLTQDHDPGDAKEQGRIRARNGVITSNSLGVPIVNGRLGMTRSLGDPELKPYGVCAHPMLTSIGIRHSHDAFLVMVTDGITFVMPNEELCDLISTSSEPREAADLIIDQALQFGSEDNVSCVVVPFGSWGKFAKLGSKVGTSFGRNIISSRFFAG